MERNLRDLGKALAILLKPGPGKVALFALLFGVLAFLPLYPVHGDEYVGPSEAEAIEFESSGTSMKSLFIVMEENYNWTDMYITLRQVNLWTVFEDYHVIYYDANPAFLWLYGMLGFMAYFASCYYVESVKLERAAK